MNWAQPIPATVSAVKLKRRLFAGTSEAAAESAAAGGGDGTSSIVRLPAGIGTGICPGDDAKWVGHPGTK